MGNCQSHLYLRMDWSVTLATFALYLSSWPVLPSFLMDTLSNDHIFINNNCHARNTRYANVNMLCL